jgi:hypothetical protein
MDSQSTQTEREKFEKWADREGYSCALERDGETYCDPATHAAWWAWQARASIGKEDALGEPVAVGYAAFGTYEGRKVALMGYAAESVWAVKEKVFEVAKREGYIGGVDQRLQDLGWTITPLYSRPSQGEAMEALSELVESDALLAKAHGGLRSNDDKIKLAKRRLGIAWDRARSVTAKGDGNV